MTRAPHSLEKIDYIEGNRVFHYTCNAPKQKTLEKLGIEAVGDEYGANKKEVLIIPVKLYERFGLKINDDKGNLRITSEILLRKISERFD